jgi:phosphoribosyl-ATP pyrophosphohydrolase
MDNNSVQDLFDVIKERKNSPVEQSYTNYLFEKGIDKILKKVGEEASEVIISSKNDNNHETVMEICDLTYHVLVLMAEKGIELGDIEKELEVRRQKIGNKKPERKVE